MEEEKVGKDEYENNEGDSENNMAYWLLYFILYIITGQMAFLIVSMMFAVIYSDWDD